MFEPATDGEALMMSGTCPSIVSLIFIAVEHGNSGRIGSSPTVPIGSVVIEQLAVGLTVLAASASPPSNKSSSKSPGLP